METSESIKQIAPALVAAQKKIEGATKDSENPYFSSKYADLSSVMGACKEALNENGIVILQTTVPTDSLDRLVLQTTLLHESSEWVRSTLIMPTVKGDPQAFGSALTYARRYALGAFVGVCPEDDDAEAATSRPITREAAQVPAKRPNVPSQTPKPKKAEVPKGLASKPGEYRIDFGKNKGKALADLDDETVGWYYNYSTKNISDPDKARFKQSNMEMQVACWDEMERRKAEPHGIQSDPLHEVFGDNPDLLRPKTVKPTEPDKDAWTSALLNAKTFDDLKGLVAALKLKSEDDPQYEALMADADIQAAFTKRDKELRA